MTIRKDITNRRFGRLVAQTLISVSRSRTKWLCLCDCGKPTITSLQSLSSGKTKSCGCLAKETTGNRRRTHGLRRSGEYASWMQMIQRCTNPRDNRWPQYGGRGIRVAKRWETFENFIADMGKRPAGTTLDRIKNDGDYEPGNCRWATRVVQQNNTTRNRFVTAFGQTLTVSEWSRRTGISNFTIYRRLDAGRTGEDAVSAPRYRHYGLPR